MASCDYRYFSKSVVTPQAQPEAAHILANSDFD
jgi:hypothetical protein